MSLVKKLLFGAGGALILLLAVGVFLPATAHVEREIQIDAPAATVFALVNDFRRMNQWSPWVDSDANALYTITGPPRGVGAGMSWDGQIVGRGSQVIVESDAFARVVSQLDLGGQGKATSTFELQKTGDGTIVTWGFDKDSGYNLPGRYFGLLLERIVGPDYEKGLDNLKLLAEGLPAADFSDIEIEHRNIDAVDIAFLPTSSVPEAAAISAALGAAYFRLLNFIDSNDLTEAGAPMSIGGSFNGSELQFSAAIPIRGNSDRLSSGDSGVQIGSSYAGRVIRVMHTGSYRTLGQTHDKIAAYLAALGIERNGDSWESYISDPTRVDEKDLLTYVYYPIRDSL